MIPFVPLLAVILFATIALAQSPAPGTTKDDEDVVKAGPKDPFTQRDQKAMAALGIVAYGPLPWGDGLRTTDVDKVLGENRVLWLETRHFRIGCNLGNTGIPQDPDARKLVNGELQELRKKWSKLPERASKLEPWLRLHLYAHRAESLYAEVAKLVQHDDTATTFLGQPDKFLILLFQRKSDLARYLDRFCGVKSTHSQRHYYGKSRQNGLMLTAEGDEDTHGEAEVYAQFRFHLIQCFLDARGGAPYWLSTGLAHYYERQVPCNLMNTAPKEDENVDPNTQNNWHRKVRARVQRDSLVIPFFTLSAGTDFGYFAHLQAWSRVDYLMALDRGKFGTFLAGLEGSFSSARQQELLGEIYAMDAEAFDKKWRDWVGKTYK